MSRSLVKQALELCNSDDDMSSNGMKSKYEDKKHKNLKTKANKNNKKPNKSLIEKYVLERNKNNLEKNLGIIKKLSKPVIRFDTIRTAILDKPSLEAISKQQKIVKKIDQESFFTEQEFKDFEKSYFNKK